MSDQPKEDPDLKLDEPSKPEPSCLPPIKVPDEFIRGLIDLELHVCTMPDHYDVENEITKRVNKERGGKNLHCKLKYKDDYKKLRAYLRDRGLLKRISPCFSWMNGRTECVVYLTSHQRAKDIEIDIWKTETFFLNPTGGIDAEVIENLLYTHKTKENWTWIERNTIMQEPIKERSSETSSTYHGETTPSDLLEEEKKIPTKNSHSRNSSCPRRRRRKCTEVFENDVTTVEDDNKENDGKVVQGNQRDQLKKLKYSENLGNDSSLF